MAMYPKPEPRARAKRRKHRVEATVIQTVYRYVKNRDGYCRIAGVLAFGTCAGRSEFAHLEGRYKTRGMPPERRHRPEASLMLCGAHHRTGPCALDLHRMTIVARTPAGADGPLEFRTGAFVYREE